MEGPKNINATLIPQLTNGTLKTQEFVIDILNGDELKFISGQYTNQIECIKLETIKGNPIFIIYLLAASINQGNSITVGKIKKNSKEFHIDIKRDEHPIILFGGLDIKRYGLIIKYL